MVENTKPRFGVRDDLMIGSYISSHKIHDLIPSSDLFLVAGTDVIELSAQV